MTDSQVSRGTSTGETAGNRLYAIRLACGDGVRRAESMDAFVQRVGRITGEKYHATTISMLERDQQNWRLEDVRVFAAVDPMNRGEIWLSALHGPADVTPERDRPKPREIQSEHLERLPTSAERAEKARKKRKRG